MAPAATAANSRSQEGRAWAAGAGRLHMQPEGPFKQPPAPPRARGKTGLALQILAAHV